VIVGIVKLYSCNASEIDIITENVGTAILTLASATGPTPFPTKIPSITILTDINIIPNKVGKKYSKKLFTTDCVLSFSLTLAMISPQFESSRIIYDHRYVKLQRR